MPLGPTSCLLCHTPPEACARDATGGFDPQHQACCWPPGPSWLQAVCPCSTVSWAPSLERFVGFCEKADQVSTV